MFYLLRMYRNAIDFLIVDFKWSNQGVSNSFLLGATSALKLPSKGRM